MRYPERAQQLGVDPEEPARWRQAAHNMLVPYDEALGVHPRPRSSPSTPSGTSPGPTASDIR